ncbi:MAG: cysteine desulfurase family protein [Acidimicrobiales bacterium]
MNGRSYLDHASTSPARPEVVAAMLEWMSGPGSGDPARVHSEGQMARAAIEEAREAVAALIGVRPRQCIFTSGATEAVNAAVWGAVRARAGGAITLPATEHSCVREASLRLAPVLGVGVDHLGRVDLGSYEAALDRGAQEHGRVALAHCQWGNHEIATLQPVAGVVALASARGVMTHVDAAAACGHVPIDLASLGADLVSISAHKLGGPKGVGALIVAPGLRLEPLLVGGDQERGRRAGIENTPAIVGFGVAARLLTDGRADGLADGQADGLMGTESSRARRQTELILEAVSQIPGSNPLGDPTKRLPHIVCVAIEGVEAEAVLLGLDQVGIAAHSGSACSSESLAPSPVLEAIGVDAERSLRLSVGWSTTDHDIRTLVRALPAVIEQLRALRPH